MYTILMLATAVAAALFLAMLLWFVFKITALLDQIGGLPASLLSKLRFGLRAIEGETGHLPPLLGRLNEQLAGIAAGLAAVKGHLDKTIEAALRQEEQSS